MFREFGLLREVDFCLGGAGLVPFGGRLDFGSHLPMLSVEDSDRTSSGKIDEMDCLDVLLTNYLQIYGAISRND
jgi:hypothetical protein